MTTGPDLDTPRIVGEVAAIHPSAPVPEGWQETSVYQYLPGHATVNCTFLIRVDPQRLRRAADPIAEAVRRATVRPHLTPEEYDRAFAETPEDRGE